MASNERRKSEDRSNPNDGTPDEEAGSKKKTTKMKKIVLRENARSLVDTGEEDEDELRKFSSTSIKTNSKIVNDVIYDLSSLSSETMQANIELSEVDKQRIEQFRTRHRQQRSYGFRKRLVFDVSYFRTCSFFKQLFILLLSFLVILDSFILRNGEPPFRHRDVRQTNAQLSF